MPELPEVEHIARGLRPVLVGRTVVRAVVFWSRAVAFPEAEGLAGEIQGRRVRSVGRRGKYFVLELDKGWLLVHLRMTGRLRRVAADEPPGKPTRLALDLDDGWSLRFDDVRKLGRVYLVDDPAQVTRMLGPEPLADQFQLEDLRRLLGKRRGRLKPLLANQRFLAGVGNIYADEVLFCARLHPLRRADTLSDCEQARLFAALRSVLEQAIVGHGTTLDDGGYVDSTGASGSFQHEICVYGRTGKPCRVCGVPIRRLVIAQRSAHFCPICQSADEGA